MNPSLVGAEILLLHTLHVLHLLDLHQVYLVIYFRFGWCALEKEREKSGKKESKREKRMAKKVKREKESVV